MSERRSWLPAAMQFRALALGTILLCVAAVPALVGLGLTARDYLATSQEIAALRFEIVDIHAVAGADGPVPEVVLRARGVESVPLTLAEVNFDLEWQGHRVATGLAYPNLPLTGDVDTTITVPTSLNADYATQTRALLAGGQAPFTLDGRARVVLPDGNVMVWLTLSGSYRRG
ncbi:MAG TPA: LEA type 2 family protein [Thermomicrobiales bacterium]|nr:LEA type 2 family protein [Thermomicrobiales bacterium]